MAKWSLHYSSKFRMNSRLKIEKDPKPALVWFDIVKNVVDILYSR